ncbi:hypothetical protein [Segeticoccus rhizosphaerae]|jgi:hypothetical protein|uniref:hypothetical protein n=1 Tax=Segeticoccus rhizosphaerae TaxID=1104777 RepID=UPI0010BFE81E|nr:MULTISPECIES: hypothetical protein [Intrasporangiaceae]
MAVDRNPPSEETAGQHGDLVDRPLQEEIELVGALVAAVSAHRGTLSEEEIDRLLGVRRPGEAPSGGTEPAQQAPTDPL